MIGVDDADCRGVRRWMDACAGSPGRGEDVFDFCALTIAGLQACQQRGLVMLSASIEFLFFLKRVTVLRRSADCEHSFRYSVQYTWIR